MSATVQAPVVPAAVVPSPVAPPPAKKTPWVSEWGAILVTLLIFAAYFLWIAIAVQLKLDKLYDSLSQLAQWCVNIAVGYWLGSSKSSQDKTAVIQNSVNPPTPGA